MNLNNYKHIFMIGIGGISMSGIAEILVSWGYQVSGSDANESKQTTYLIKNGIDVKIGHNKDNIDDDVDLVVYSAAIKQENPEYQEAMNRNILLIERGAFLGELTRLFSNTIGIAGTHGKTTTTSMVASAFLEANYDPTIQVGAYLKCIDGNYRVGKSDTFIIEACEYCDSYLSFHQKSAIVLNIDNDHLDYFKNIENIEKSFQKYVSLLPEDGYLVLNHDDERTKALKNFTKAKVITVGTNHADWTFNNVIYDKNGYPTFDVYFHEKYMEQFTLSVTGEYNILNALCCIALCYAYNISLEDIKKALKTFDGAARRMEYKGVFHDAHVFDDYGHHPTEVSKTSKGLHKKQFHESWVVFEAHTYSRLKTHLESFAESLSDFDHIIITNIYAARETNTFGISEDDLIKELEKRGKKAIHIADFNEIKQYLEEHVSKDDIILTLGAGNVTKLADLLVDKEM